MSVWAYVFISSRHPKRLLPRVRGVVGVVHADALFESPDIIAIVAGRDVKRITLAGMAHFLCSHDHRHLSGLQWLFAKLE